MFPNISVVIVTYNGQNVISKCLNTLSDNSNLFNRIVIVDNNSSDSTLNILEQFKEEIDLISLDENIGFGGANNIGIKKALNHGADYVLLLNQDVYFDGDNLSTFLRASTNLEDKNIGVFSPIHIDESKDQLDYNFRTFLFKHDPSSLIDAALLDSIESNKSYPITFSNAAIWLLPKDTLRLVGGFDPLFFHYGEDRNFVNRLRHQKLSIHIIPKTYAIHNRQQTDGLYKKKHLAKFQFLVEASDPNANFPILSLLARIVYRNYIVNPNNKINIIIKSIKDLVVSIGKLRKCRNLRASYYEQCDYRYLQ